MKSKLDEQTDGNDHTGDIRREKARVVDHLQNRGRIVRLKSGLIKSFAAITQRMIHVNQDIAIHGTFRIDQRHFAREIFRDLRPGVVLVGEFLERDAVWFVVAHDAKRDHPCPTGAGKCLRRAERIRNEPCA